MTIGPIFVHVVHMGWGFEEYASSSPVAGTLGHTLSLLRQYGQWITVYYYRPKVRQILFSSHLCWSDSFRILSMVRPILQTCVIPSVKMYVFVITQLTLFTEIIRVLRPSPKSRLGALYRVSLRRISRALAYQYRYMFLRLNHSFVLILFRPAVPMKKTPLVPVPFRVLAVQIGSSISFSLIGTSSLSLNISAHLSATLLWPLHYF